MVDLIKLDYHLKDLEKTLTMMSTLLNSMVEERNTEVTEIGDKIKSIAEGTETADAIELAKKLLRLLKMLCWLSNMPILP